MSATTRRSWRYWRQRRVERDVRVLYTDEWKSWREELEKRRRALRYRLVPAQVAHFRALDQQRVKEFEQLKAKTDGEIARLTGLLRDVGLQYWAPVAP